MSSGEGRPVPAPASLDDASDLALLYTSGTMGKPKGVRLSHRAIVETSVRSGEAVEIGPEDRVFAALPFFAIFGFGVAVSAIAVAGVARRGAVGPRRAPRLADQRRDCRRARRAG